ncbi:(Fe-S)-binding protein [Nitrosophilus alvini]|uniref:(Fe-S)-binding protein n=1 Tax=Nitrosophilus alvini TaxID=2714855 RepID=UPI00190DF3BD|nr:(Fe-S)-binding protein [Nitrosophilus alvini]
MFNFSKISNDCIKCGKCIPVCTIHSVNPDETTSPRGFIELLGAYEKGNLPLDKTAKDIFESCFLCTNCVDVCPNSLPTDMIIEEVRADIAKKYGIAWYKKAFFWLLRHRWAMDIASKLGYVFKSCAVKEERKRGGLIPRFDLPMVKKERLLPSIASRSFLNSYPERIEAETADKEKRQRVAIFIGCLANYNYTGIGDSLVKILKALEIDILIPKKQKCCAAPAYFTGDFDTVEALAKENIEYFESFIDDVDAIIIPEATCSAMVKHDWEIFFKNRGMMDWARRSSKLNEKIFMATEWLYKNSDLEKLLKARGKSLDISVTYHDPCHARKVQGIWKEPRELLSKNYRLKEMSDPNRCCGFGGVTIQSEKFHLAQAAGLPKAAMIKETKADIVSAECSACRVQLSNSLYQNGVETIFKNPIELIAEALE